MFIVSIMLVVNVTSRFSRAAENQTLMRTLTRKTLPEIDGAVRESMALAVGDLLKAGASVQVMSVSHSVAWAPAEAFVETKAEG